MHIPVSTAIFNLLERVGLHF